MSQLIPNSYQTPNFIADKLLRHLSGPQAKVLMTLCRKTFGWNKREDVISFSQFREEAGVSRSSAIEALRVFVDAGLVLKTSKGRVDMNAWSLNLDADVEKVLQRLMPGKKRPADVDNNRVPEANWSSGRTSTAGGLVQPADQSWSAQRSSASPPVGPTETQETQETQIPLPPLNSPERSDQLLGLVLTAPSARKPAIGKAHEASDDVMQVWQYYVARLKRGPHLELTKQRRAMGEAGLKACRRMAALSGSVAPDVDAIELMKLAIDRLAESPWHNGVNETRTKYLGWELLFRSRELPCPQKLTDYWLNDEKFPEKRGAA
ncbi:MAG: putative phage replication protein [Edaphobacter sp.]|nr:putative phage replication protein [Edaphobacter sp.]